MAKTVIGGTAIPGLCASLLLLASRAARAGNVPAIRLLSELLDPTAEGNTDELSEFDELAHRRQAR